MHATIGFYHFDRLEDDEASELLLRAADNHEPRTSKLMALASAITRKLGALPLALVHAGNAIKAKYCQLNNYIPYYERSWQMIRRSRRVTGQDEDDAGYMKVYASYEIVFRGLEAIKLQRYSDAVQLLKLFSFLHYEHIPFEMLTAAVRNPRIQREADAQLADKQGTALLRFSSQLSSWSRYFRGIIDSVLKKQFENQYPVILPTFLRDAELSTTSDDCVVRLREALHLLIQLSLVTYYEGSDSYSMHPLVHTWVRERPQMTAGTQAVWCEAALHTLSRCVLLPPLNESVDPHGNLARRLLPHIISVGKLQQKIEEEFANNRCERNRPWPALESSISPWRAMFLVKCALVHSECGYFVEAEACLRTVMSFNQKFLGPNHPRTERVTLVVSDCLWQQGRVHEAAELQEQVFMGNLKTLGPNHPRTLRAMDKLGESRRQQGRFAESIELLTKAMDGMRVWLPDTDPAIYHVLEQLGVTLRTCFCFKDAREYQEEAVAGMKTCFGERDMRTLIAMDELAITYKDLSTVYMKSDQQLAHQYLETAHKHAIFVVEQRRKQLGDKQPLTWMAHRTLGRIKAAMGDVDEAERLFSSILPVAARHLGDDHIGVLNGKNHYARILIQQKRYSEAEIVLLDISRPVKYKTATFTGDHPDRWDALWTLVECYQKQGKIVHSLATCNELLKAISTIRQGREQTETSSTFWKMVLDKKAELLIVKDSSPVEDFTSEAYKPPDNNLVPTVFQTGANSTSSDTRFSATQKGWDLRLRGTTW